MTGAFFQLGPLLGLTGTVIGMVHAFITLSSSSTSDPQRLSANMGNALIATTIGLGFCLVGLVFINIALFGMHYRAPWFFWFLMVYGGVLLLGFPVGTVMGVALLAFCLMRKEEFLAPSAATGRKQNA